MKTIPFVPACQNMEEIQKLAVLITDFIHPEMIVLFGRYAGMPSYDIRGGYELLILTANQLAVGVKEVMGYLAMNFPEKDRKDCATGQPGIHQQAGIAPISIEEMPTDKALIGNLRLHWSRPKMCQEAEPLRTKIPDNFFGFHHTVHTTGKQIRIHCERIAVTGFIAERL